MLWFTKCSDYWINGKVRTKEIFIVIINCNNVILSLNDYKIEIKTKVKFERNDDITHFYVIEKP